MRFELTIPPGQPYEDALVVPVEAPNWLAALSKVLKQTGGTQIAKGKALCEVKGDGTIVVKDTVYEKVFYLRPEPEEGDPKQEPEADAAEPEITATPTITYLEADLKEKKLGVPQTMAPNPATPMSVNHPCMVLPKAEIQRRIGERKQAAPPKSAVPAVPATDSKDGAGPAPKADKPVQLIHVVEVETTTADTLTTLKVDLDALREASNSASPHTTENIVPPLGFEWLRQPVDSALAEADTPDVLAERTLRLSMAALPCRLTAFISLNPQTETLSVKCALGELGEQLVGTTYDHSEGLLAACLHNSLSAILEAAGGGPYSVDSLNRELGTDARTAIMASVTDGRQTSGVLLLADPLSGKHFTTTELAVANYLAMSVYCALQKCART